MIQRCKVQIFDHFVAKAHQIVPSKFLLLDGNCFHKSSFFGSICSPIRGSWSTQFSNCSHLISFLRNSIFCRSLGAGKIAHAFILRSGSESNLVLCNNLLHLYWICGSERYAVHLFDEMLVRDVVSWNTMISGYIRFGLFLNGFSFFREMRQAGIQPTQASFVSAVVASAAIGSSRYLWQVHGLILNSGILADCFVGNALLKGYVDSGGVEEFRKLSEEMCSSDDASIEILLRGYSQHGLFNDAFRLFKYCCQGGLTFSCYAISSLMSLCTSSDLNVCAIQLQGYVVKVGLEMNVSVVNSLITMYSRFHSLDDAHNLFNWSTAWDIVTWNSLISGFAYNKKGDAGVGLVQRMLLAGTQMNGPTFLSFLSCCAAVTIFENAKRAHVQIVKLREHVDQGTDNIILTMYCKSRGLEDAENVFQCMEHKDNVSFNLMMNLYRKVGHYEESIELFIRAQSEGRWVDEAMLSSAICSCSKLNCLHLGEQIHGSVVKAGFEKVTQLANSLLEIYSQGGKINEMEKIFYEIEKPDLFSWNTLLMCYAHFRLHYRVSQIWQEMKQSGVGPNEFSYSALLDTCRSVRMLLVGKQIHAHIQKLGLTFDTTVVNSLITMYSNCQVMEDAFAMFEDTSFPDNISWNVMVSGYAQNGLAEESVKFYITMNRNGIEVNHITYASICMAYATLSNIHLGSQFHAHVIKRACETDVSLSNSLITMYGKCGHVRESVKIFQTIVLKDVITWNSLICAYGHNGHVRDAIKVFEQMTIAGFKPNNVTFVGVLSACSHTGLVSEAWKYFKSMYADYSIVPCEEHYSCMVDILCRAGMLQEAKSLIESMPFDPCALVWRILLNACKANGDLNLGEIAAKRIMQLEPQDPTSYILLSDLYASVGNRKAKAKLRRLMKDMKVKKEVGVSWVSS